MHWTVAALLLIQVPVAFGMLGQSPGPTQDVLFNLHKNVGLIIFVLAIVRLAWRVAHPVPYLLHHHLVRKDWVLRRMMSSTEPLQGIESAGAAERKLA